VDIECDRRDGYRYYIENWDEIDQDEVKRWLLSIFAVSNAIHDCKSLRNRIAYDKIPSGNDKSGGHHSGDAEECEGERHPSEFLRATIRMSMCFRRIF
jgi:hypothetical protein